MRRSSWMRLIRWVFLWIPMIGFAIGFTGYSIYVFRSVDYGPLIDAESAKSVSRLAVFAHGLGDSASSWSLALADAYRERVPDAAIVNLAWSPWSDNPLRCSVDGRRIGQALGLRFAAHEKLERVHLVAHSCGAFVAFGLCESLKAESPQTFVQVSYLDPLAVYGGLFWDFGLNHFGTCADFSEAYIDTGDGVPGSNVALPGAHTFDVTGARISRGFVGIPHVWPTHYYRQIVEAGTAPGLSDQDALAERYPKGKSTSVDR